MSNEARTQVEKILANTGVKFSAIHTGQRKRDNWDCDAWVCKFERAQAIVSAFAPRAGGATAHSETFDYFTGLGNRKPMPWNVGAPGYDCGPKPRPGTMLYAQWMESAKPQTPHPADVLHSLIADSSATGQSFADWCSDFGYDTDSRKAFATYEACQQNADKLARLFDRVAREALIEALQDY